MGEKQPHRSISPCPTHPRNSFHPFQHPAPSLPPSDCPSSYISSKSYLKPHPQSMKPQTPTPCATCAHKPHAGCSIANSNLHPHVPAADRIFSWCTPFGSCHQHDVVQQLPPPLIESAMMVIQGALAPNTKSTYAAGLLHFTQFCDKWGISEEVHMPADYALLCAFIGEYKGLHSGNTIRSWMSGLHSWHVMNHAPWCGDDDWVHLACTSANKKGTKHKLTPHAPVSIEHLSCAMLLTYLILFMLLCGPSPWLPFLAAATSGKLLSLWLQPLI